PLLCYHRLVICCLLVLPAAPSPPVVIHPPPREESSVVTMPEITRREALASAGAAALAAVSVGAAEGGRVVQKGRLKQSVCRWCYGKIPLPEFCKAVSEIGLTAIDLIEEKEWPILAEHGLICALG